MLPLLGHYRLTELRVKHVAEAPSTVTSSAANRQRVRATLRSALNAAVREQLITVNPAALVELPSGKAPRAKVWTTERTAAWKAAIAALAAADPDGPRREQLEAACRPASPVMV